MSTIKILHLEDMPSDADLVRRALKKGNLDFELKLVDNRADFIKALNEFNPDIILSDHSLPSFNSHEALLIYKQANLQIPFILITATISEEFAVGIMKEGACDYILKDRMERLPNAVLSALEKYRVEAERQEYLNEVILNEALMREAESLAGYGSWQIDLLNKTAKWSNEAYRILDYVPGEVAPTIDNFLRKIHEEDVPHVKESINSVLNERKSIKMDFRLDNGQLKYCHLELALQLDSMQNPAKVVGFIQDVTKIKKAEDEIKQLNESLERKVEERTLQLQEANRELEAFNYSISHDMRNPLQVINGFASVITLKYKDTLNQDAIDLLQKIKSHTKQMGQLVEDLLNFSRSGRHTLETSKMDMTDMVNTIVKDLKIIYTEADVKIGELIPAYCDHNLIKQVWVNLISNALKYSSRKNNPVVEIGSEVKGKEDIYFVKDNGAGFSMEHANRLFGVFSRLHDSSEFEGSGVGLAIVQRIIVKHGGRIWAEGKVGEGATFYFSLPAESVEDMPLNI